MIIALLIVAIVVLLALCFLTTEVAGPRPWDVIKSDLKFKWPWEKKDV